MDDFGVQLHPIPRTCPIPRNVVGLIGGYTGSSPTFVLSLNHVEITIEAPTDPPGFPADAFDSEHPFYDWFMHERSVKIYAHYLEIIQSLLGNLKFGKTNWAYLTYQGRLGYQLTQRNRVLPKVTCPPWAPFIHESEVEYTVYGLAGDRRGIWNDKEVDIMIGWTEMHIRALDHAMYGYRMLEGMDLTFEVYGHLIGSDGSIIGIVTEAGWGRYPTLKDRTRIYQAVAKVQQRGMLYRACLTNRFMIANGKVRLIDTAAMRCYAGQREELEREAETWHWYELSLLFYEIEHIGPYGDYRIPLRRFTTSYKDLEYLPLPPSPEKPLGGIMLTPGFFKNHFVQPWPEYCFEPDEEVQQKSNKKMVIRNISSASRLFVEHVPTDGADWEEGEDRPLSLAAVQFRYHRRAFLHPYGKRQRKPRYLTDSENTSSHSSTSH